MVRRSWFALLLMLLAPTLRAESERALELRYRVDAAGIELESALAADGSPQPPAAIAGQEALRFELRDADGQLRSGGRADLRPHPDQANVRVLELRLPWVPGAALRLLDFSGRTLRSEPFSQDLLARAEASRQRAETLLQGAVPSRPKDAGMARQQAEVSSQRLQRLRDQLPPTLAADHLQRLQAIGKGRLNTEQNDALRALGINPAPEGDPTPWLARDRVDPAKQIETDQRQYWQAFEPAAPVESVRQALELQQQAWQRRQHTVKPAAHSPAVDRLPWSAPVPPPLRAASLSKDKAAVDITVRVTTDDGGTSQETLCVYAYQVLSGGGLSYSTAACGGVPGDIVLTVEEGLSYQLYQYGVFPYVPGQVALDRASAGQLVNMTLSLGLIMSGSISTSNGATVPNVYGYAYSAPDYRGVSSYRQTGNRYEMALERQAGAVYDVYFSTDDHYQFPYNYGPVGPLHGDSHVFDLVLDPGVAQPAAQLRLAEGGVLGGNERVYCFGQRADGRYFYANSEEWDPESQSQRSTIDPQTGNVRLPVVATVDYRCSAYRMAPPYLDRLFDSVRFGTSPAVFEVERGVAISGSLSTSDGQPTPAVNIHTDIVGPTVFQHVGYLDLPAGSTAYRVAVPRSQSGHNASAIFTPASGSLYVEQRDVFSVSMDDVARDVTLRKGFIVQGQLQLTAGALSADQFPYISCSTAPTNGTSYGAFAQLSSDGAFSLRVLSEVDYRCFVQPGSPYLGVNLPTVRFRDGEAFTLEVERGIEVSGQVKTQRGADYTDGGFVSCYSPNHGFYTQLSNSGQFELVLSANASYDCQVGLSDPYIDQFFSGRRFSDGEQLMVTAERGIEVTFAVRDQDSGQPLSNWQGRVLVDGIFYASLNQDFAALALPSGPTVSAEFSAQGYNSQTFGPRELVNSGTETIRMTRRLELTGRLLKQGAVQPDVRVRVLDVGRGEAFVTSVVTGSDGRFSFPLPAGRYLLEADLSEFNTLYLEPARSAVIELSAAQAKLEVDVDLSAGAAVNLAIEVISRCDSQAPVTVVAGLQRDGVRLARKRLYRSGQLASGDGGCRNQFAAGVGSGSYDVVLEVPGSAAQRVPAVVVAASGAQVTVDVRQRQSVWNGRQVNAAGQPVRGAVVLYDGVLNYVDAWSIAGDGRFSVPVTPGYVAEFLPDPALDGLLRQRVVLPADAADLPAEITLDALEFVDAASKGSAPDSLIYGPVGRIAPRKVLFIGEGYVAENEPFTDRNGNGIWDGVLWIDLDNDGVFDQNGDLVTVHGNASFPVDGSSNVTANNEPFEDRNGDGYPNINDAAVFERNVQDYLRALLGSDGWENHRDRFEAHQVLLESPQSGMDFVAVDGETFVLERDTALNASVELQRGLLSIDYALANEIAATALPDRNLVVVMINQPVRAGRANSFILANGGAGHLLANDPVAGHEAGHAIAGLADEYAEFTGSAAPVFLSSAPNVSAGTTPDAVSWGNLLPSEPYPTLVEREGTGIFEGANYVSGGAYRPSANSMMRFNSPLFNEPSLRAVEKSMLSDMLTGRIRPNATGTWYIPAEAGWGLIVVDRGSIMGVAWYTYRQDGTPIWLVGGLEEQANGSWLGEVSEYSGTPYSQINGPALDPTAPVVGSLSLRFLTPERLQFDYSVYGVTQSKALSRFRYSDPVQCGFAKDGQTLANSFTDFWFNPEQAGWGLSIDHRGDALYAAWYTFGEDRAARWFLVAPALRQTDGSYRGEVFRALAGEPFDQVDGSNEVAISSVGTASLRFDNENSGHFSFDVAGTRFQSPLLRLTYGDRPSICSDSVR